MKDPGLLIDVLSQAKSQNLPLPQYVLQALQNYVRTRLPGA
jgi:hypothetical protein